MPTPIYNFEFPRGDDHTFTLRFKDKDGNNLDITGYTIFLTVKEKVSDEDVGAVISITQTSHISPTEGLTVVTITNVMADDLKGIYYYDMQYKDAGGIILTYMRGEMVFNRDITRRTS